MSVVLFNGSRYYLFRKKITFVAKIAMQVDHLSYSELTTLGSLIGCEVQFFAQDVVNFAIIGSDWQVNICSDDVYRGDLAYFELSGLRVNVERTPVYSPEPEVGYCYAAVPGNTTIQDVHILYNLWQDEWTATNQPFNLRLEAGVLIATDKGHLIALLEPYDLAYSYPFSTLQTSTKLLKSALDVWAPHYEIVSIQDILAEGRK